MDENSISKYDEKISFSDLAILKRFLYYFKPYKFKFIFYLICKILSIFVITIEPLFLGNYFDTLSNQIATNTIDYSIIGIYGSLYVVMFLTFIALMYVGTIGFQKLGQSVVYDIREDVFNHIETLSIAQINSLPIGKYVTRVTNDTNYLSIFFTDILVNFITNLAAVISALIYAYIANWLLALILTLFLPVVFIITIFVRKHLKRNFRHIKNKISEINAFVSENISGMKTIQTFNQEERKFHDFSKINDELYKYNKKNVKIWAFYHPSMYMIHMICTITIFAVGIPLITNANPLNLMITSGTLFTFFLYSNQTFSPVQNMANLFNQFSNVLSSAEKVYGILDMKTTVEDKDDAIYVDKFEGTIEFKHVYFAYVGTDWVLKDVSFKINKGETAAFVGKTGAGKSTIIGLIVRNYNIQKGEILIDGINVNNIQIECLRKNIGQMLQDVFLFNDTIKSNISLQDKTIHEEEIIQACRYVGADKFIEKLPQKYEDMVRERGNNFSTGQRQLISFARVVTYKPRIIVLDEATANIDTETEVLIQSSLQKMRSIGTMLIVAHRLSTIKHADKIFVLSKGEIVETGNHESLIEQKGIYYQMYRLQNMNKNSD